MRQIRHLSISPHFFRRLGVGFFAVVLAISFAATAVQPVFAAKDYTSIPGGNISQKVSMYEDLIILRQCMVGNSLPLSTITKDYVDANEAPLFPSNNRKFVSWDPTVVAYHQSLQADNEMSCDEGKGAVRGALKRLQIDPTEFFCSFAGVTRFNNGTETSCQGGSGALTYSNSFGGQETFKRQELDAVIQKFTGLDGNNPGDQVRYLRSLNILKKGCFSQKEEVKAIYDKEPEDQRWKITEYKGDGEEKTSYYIEPLSTPNQKPRGADGNEKGDVNCEVYYDRTDRYYASYKKYIDGLDDSERQTLLGDVDGLLSGGGADGDGGDEKSTCAIDGLGWFVCPAMSFAGDIANAMFDFLALSLLETNSNQITDTAVETAWRSMRNFANIAFVIVFLVIIFSQLTSTGISNYGVKKMLPRLVVGALLVNASYLICQLAVDISNVLGYSLRSVFDAQNFVEVPDSQDASDNGFGIATTIATLLAGGVGVALALSLPVFLAVILALAMIVLILLVRKALIVLLIVVSPLAFVAFLLPNTEKWFKKWYETFFALLMVFPIIAVVFGASSLAANLIKATSTEPLTQLIALGVATLPLFIVPSLLKSSLKATGALGAKLSGLSGAANKKISSRVKDSSQLGLRMKEYQDARSSARQRRAIKSRSGWRGRLSDKALEKTKLKKFLGADKGAVLAAKAEDDKFSEDVALESLSLSGEANSNLTEQLKADYARVASGGKSQISEAKKIAMMDKVTKTGSFDERKTVLGLASTEDEKVRQRVVDNVIAKGDLAVYGSSMPDGYIKGEIKGEKGLAKQAVKNAASGGLKGADLAHSGAGTEWLEKSIKAHETAGGNADAHDGFTSAATDMKDTPELWGRADKKIKDSFARRGVV